MLEQIHVLNSSESALCTLSNTLPGACPIISCYQTHEALDGGMMTDTLTLTVPATHDDSQYITTNNYLVFQDTDAVWQEYRIMDTEHISGATSVVLATCEHAYYELANEPLNDIRPTTTTATLAVTEALTDTRWSIGTGADLGNNSCRIYKTSVLSGLATIAATWGGELRFYVEVTGGVITARHVDILSRRGAVTGKRFEYSKDLVSVTCKTNIQNLATALIGRGKGVEVYGGTETTDPAYGRRLEFDNVVWSTGDGDPADKPLGQNWIGDDTAKAAWGPAGRHIYGYVTFDECTDAEELLQLTYDELQIRKVPQVSYAMAVVVLEELSGYAHEAVRLGDTVDVINDPVTGTARVIYINRNLINPTDAQVTIGNYTPSAVTDMVEVKQQLNSFAGRAGTWDRSTALDLSTGSDFEYYIDLLKVQLASTVSGIYTDANGNLIIENADGTAALKLGGGILALANTKTAGEYNWRTFATGAGYVADEMTTGTLNSAIIFAGTLLAASGTFANLVAGVTGAQRMEMGSDANNDPYIRVYDNSNTLRLTIVKTGILFGTTIKYTTYTIGDRAGIGTFVG